MSLRNQLRETFTHLGNHGALPGDREALEAARAQRLLETGEHRAVQIEEMSKLAVDGALTLDPEQARGIQHINVIDQSPDVEQIAVRHG